MRPIKDVRLFFALWPDAKVRLQIAENLKRFTIDSEKSRTIANSNLHMTLHFIGNVSIAEMKCLDTQARLVTGEPFECMLDCSGFFKKPGVLWFGCQTIPKALHDLHSDLGKQIARCDYTPETRPYAPHVTMVRKIIEVPRPIQLESVLWQVNRFVLVESIPVSSGVRYEVVESYPLKPY